MDFYKKIKSHKAVNSNKWGVYGEVLGMTYDQFRMAVRRQSLDELQIKELKRVFFNEQEETEKELIKVGDNMVSLDDFALSFSKNEDKIIKHPVLQSAFKREITKEVTRILLNQETVTKWLDS